MGRQQPPYDEPYILPENLFKTYELTGDSASSTWRSCICSTTSSSIRSPEGENILPGKHGYSHVIALSSGAKAYELLGDAKYLRAIRNAWDMLEETQQYASGAWAPKETFVKPHSGELAASLTTTRDHFETPCCFLRARQAGALPDGFTGDARYGDGLERVLFNTILGALDPDDDGGYFYYSDYQARRAKGYYQRKWPCCAGTLIQSVADYPLNIYFQDARGHLREPLRGERGALEGKRRSGEADAEDGLSGIGSRSNCGWTRNRRRNLPSACGFRGGSSGRRRSR